jgi:hypothetical protein
MPEKNALFLIATSALPESASGLFLTSFTLSSFSNQAYEAITHSKIYPGAGTPVTDVCLSGGGISRPRWH